MYNDIHNTFRRHFHAEALNKILTFFCYSQLKTPSHQVVKENIWINWFNLPGNWRHYCWSFNTATSNKKRKHLCTAFKHGLFHSSPDTTFVVWAMRWLMYTNCQRLSCPLLWLAELAHMSSSWPITGSGQLRRRESVRRRSNTKYCASCMNLTHYCRE